MKRIFSVLFLAVALLGVLPVGAAKKHKVDLEHPTTVKMTGVSSDGYFVKAWAVSKNADKAMAAARIDAVLASLVNGIQADENAGGAGVTNLPALMTKDQFNEHRSEIESFFSTGEFLKYVRDVSSTYPKGADNMKTPNGRRVGLSLVLDYSGLRKMLQDQGWIKGLNDHFEYKGN